MSELNTTTTTYKAAAFRLAVLEIRNLDAIFC